MASYIIIHRSEEFPSLLIEDYISRSCEVVDEETIVNKINLADISDDLLFSLIELENVQFKDSEIGENFYSSSNELGGATNRYIVDDKGYEIIVRTSSFADFANNPLPEGNGTIRGILTRYNDDFQLFMRSEDDVNMSSARSTVNIIGLDALKSRPEGEISENAYVEGVVTLSPKNGNITDRNIVMQDETGGIVVRFDENVGTQVSEGDVLRIALNGASIGAFADVKQLSEVSFNGEIGGERIVTKVSENADLPDPLKISLEDLKSGNYQSVLVEVENIQFVKIVNDQDKLINLYDEHKMFILPSFTEGQPMALLESLSRLRPVIIFNEIDHVIQSRAGIFISNRNHEGLKKTIRHIDENYENIQELMKKNKLPTFDNFIDNLSEIILKN